MPVDVVRIWPGELKLDTLQFDKRLGYDAANGRKALVDGCARALEALRNRWAQADPATLDETTQRSREKVLEVVQPKDGGGWHCAHMACRYRDVCPQAI